MLSGEAKYISGAATYIKASHLRMLIHGLKRAALNEDELADILTKSRNAINISPLRSIFCMGINIRFHIRIRGVLDFCQSRK